MKKNNNTSLSDGTKLCLECGLCCTGVFHADAIINSPEDKECAKSFDAIIVSQNGKEYFELPCPVFEGKCTIYPHNPSVCRNHKCNLLVSIDSGEIKLEKAIAIVREMKQIIHTIEHDSKFSSLERNTKRMTSIFDRFFDSIPIEERKNLGNLLKKYGAFSYLKKKYFYEE